MRNATGSDKRPDGEQVEREGIDTTALILSRDNPSHLDALRLTATYGERLTCRGEQRATGTADIRPASETPVYGPKVCDVLDTPTRNALPAVAERPGYSYSRDTDGGIVSLNWGSKSCTFKRGQQARAIAELVCAYERGRHAIAELVIGGKVGSDGSFRIDTLFRKGHRVWEILEKVEAKTYRLKSPEQSA